MKKKICANCMTEFKPTHGKEQKFCSKECYHEYANLYGFEKAGFNDFTDDQHLDINLTGERARGPYEDLGNAIVYQAVKDASAEYRDYKVSLTGKGKEIHKLECIRILKDLQKGMPWTQLDGDHLIKATIQRMTYFYCKAKIVEHKKSYNAHKKKLQTVERSISELKANLLPSGIAYDSDPVDTSPIDQMSNTMAEIDELERTAASYREIMSINADTMLKYTADAPPIIVSFARLMYINGLSEKQAGKELKRYGYELSAEMIQCAADKYNQVHHITEEIYDMLENS